MLPIFQQAEDRYKTLRAQYASGEISAEQYQAAVKSLIVRDEHGVYWAINPGSGGWMKAVGDKWQPDTPGSPAAPVQALVGSPRQSQRGCRKVGCGCLAALLLTLFLCVLSVAGGYFVLRKGLISSRTIFTLLGSGPGDIAITNLSTNALNVGVEMLDDTRYGYSVAMPTFLGPGDIGSYSLEPSRYKFVFKDDTDQVIGSCTLRINSGDRYTLMAQGQEIYILHNEQADPAGIAIQNSGFCIGTESP